MENFNYNVIIKNNGNEIVIKTNDVNYAIRECLRANEAGCDVCLCNGFTGEVLCHNGDEPYYTAEMGLAILGYLCAENWGDEVVALPGRNLDVSPCLPPIFKGLPS